MSSQEKILQILGHTIRLSGISAEDPYFAGLVDNFEPAFAELGRRLVREDYVCIDIGANIGLKTLLLAQIAHAGRVVAIEPSPTVADCLARNVEANRTRNVTIEQTAIGDANGTTKFVDASAYGFISEEGIEVPLATLRALVERLALDRVDFIKIDVEGFEYRILKSSIDLINRFEALVLFEFNSWCQIAHGGTNPKDFLQWVLANFEYVFAVQSGGAGSTLLDPIEKGDWLRSLRRNMIEDGCVTDILVTNARWRLKSSTSSLIQQLSVAVAERDKVVKERDTLRAERNSLLASNSWALTAPLRWVGRWAKSPKR